MLVFSFLVDEDFSKTQQKKRKNPKMGVKFGKFLTMATVESEVSVFWSMILSLIFVLAEKTAISRK